MDYPDGRPPKSFSRISARDRFAMQLSAHSPKTKKHPTTAKIC